MNRTPLQLRALRVMGDLCNETLAPEDQQWLEAQLCSSSEMQELYIDYMSMHACLQVEGAALEPLVTPSVGEPLHGAPGGGSGASRVDSRLRGEEGLSGFFSGQRNRLFMLAASLAAVALFSSALTYSSMLLIESVTHRSQLADGTGDASQGQVVARITGTQNCLWGRSSASIGYGSELVVGQKLELREGLAEVTFESGATVLLESPVKFVVDAPDRVNLQMGRLAAVVPAQTGGFHVHTQSLEICDGGTEFGLFAKQSGTAEVHVFSGLVKAQVLDSSGRPLRQFELNASEAARVNPVSTTVLEFPADEAAFVRNMQPTTGPQDGLLAYEGFDYPEGPLSAQNGGYGWAGPWFDIAADSEVLPDSNRVGIGSLTTKGLPPLGNRAVQAGHQNRIRRSLATSVGGVFDTAGLVENQNGLRLVGLDGHQVYISFLQRVSKVDDEFYGVELHRGDGNPNRVLSIGNGAEETGFGATSNYNVYGPNNFPALGTENSETNLYVVKISFGRGDHDIVEIFRNPESLKDEKACQVDAVLKGNFAFDRISMANFHGTKIHEVDEIRVGTHFLAVTGRWGGERGVLLRRITEHSMPEKTPTRWATALEVRPAWLKGLRQKDLLFAVVLH